MLIVAFIATWMIPLALGTYAWLKTRRRIGTVDEFVALAGSLSGWAIVLLLAIL